MNAQWITYRLIISVLILKSIYCEKTHNNEVCSE